MSLADRIPSDEQTANPNGDVAPASQDVSPRLKFPVVAIGASAGGLEAYIEFFKEMPADSGMAFILIQHLSPDRESMVADILSKHAAMQVQQVEDGARVEPNQVYVIRPGHTLTIERGRLRLGASLTQPGHARPVDDFFRSLAEEQRERSIAIIMSGMGSNGSAGVEAIKAVGGLAIAQEPESAKFPHMPRHLIESGHADFVLRPAEMPGLLLRYAAHPYVRAPRPGNTVAQSEQEHLSEIITVLRARTRRDFSGYKKPTVLRRIQRRMGLNQIDDLGDYARLLRQSALEVSALTDDLMINVTGFFRDEEAWNTLRNQVIFPLIQERDSEDTIRCWVTACSSGEEAYSLAMLLWEVIEAAGKAFDVKVFATDTGDRALSKARQGVFPMGIEAEVSPERLARFFDREDAMYRIKKEIRQLVVFAPQNVIQDPPFSRLDVCTCRNLLIYLEPELQRRVLSLLHFGLRDGGALFLGASETIAGVEHLFQPIDKKARIYRRVGPAQHGVLDFAFPAASPGDADASSTRQPSKASIAQLAQRRLLERYTPAAVTVDRQHRIAFFHGDVSPFLAHPAGEPTRELMAMVRDQFRGSLRIALHEAAAANRRASCRDGLVEIGDQRYRVEIVVEPLDVKLAPGHFLISFLKHDDVAPTPASHDLDAPTRDADELTDQLSRARGELQSTVEELQATNEEMRAANEETMSVNEELQSTNEELETSKEELQSLNEELTTVNVQLESKMEELEATANDLESLLASTDIAVIFLDDRLLIRRYTPAAKDLLQLIPSDIGRPMSDLAKKFVDPDLLAACRSVLEKLVREEKEVVSDSGRAYVRRILPYRTRDNRIDGVVITFVDVTALKTAEGALSQSEDDLAKALVREQTARREAEDGSRLKDKYLATLSHELRTPLSTILIWSQVLRDKSIDGAESREGLEVIERSAQAQRQLLDDLLDTSRIASGKVRLERKAVDLPVVLRQAIEEVGPSALAKNIRVDVDLGQDFGPVFADPDRLRQVFTNVLTNAMKFTPSEGAVRVRLARDDGWARLEITDSGQGIEPRFLLQIFQPFSQADSSITRAEGGLGLGLAICKELVELHGGLIQARSDGVGHGATFIIRLPLPAADQFIEGRQHVEEQSAPAATSIDAARVLLVEDDSLTRNALERFLNQEGALVIVAEDAAAAVTAYEQSRPDVIVSDIGLPQADGYQLIRQIRSLEAQRGLVPTPAIALTAFASSDDRRQARDAGYNHHLPKPATPAKLKSLIADLLAQNRRQA